MSSKGKISDEYATPQLTIFDSSSSYQWQHIQRIQVHHVSQHSMPRVLHDETATPANGK